jgi:RNA-directed DNA polymerase
MINPTDPCNKEEMAQAYHPPENITEEIVCDANMFASYDYVVSHLETQQQRERYRNNEIRNRYVRRLQEEIASGAFRIRQFRTMIVTDGPKDREVQAPTVYYRIGCNAIMTVICKYIYPTFITNTAASIKGRGTHWLHHRLHEDLQQDSEHSQYFYKSDIRHFYDSINQTVMMHQIREYIADETLLPILEDFVCLLPTGLSKGLRSSQEFANLHLSAIDKLMSDEAGYYTTADGERRYRYYRYCDDVVIRGASKRELWRLAGIYKRELSKLGLQVKSSEAVRPLSEGIDYLGYVDYGTHSLLRKRIKQRFARHITKVKSRRRRRELIGSFKGSAVHADCNHLFRVLTKKPMKKFGDMGVHATFSDGKKQFPGKTYRLAIIQNKRIEIHDFERDIKTQNGDNRYLVSFRIIDENTWGKFFTNSTEMKNILDQIREQPDGFPFETVILSDAFDTNKIKYNFS